MRILRRSVRPRVVAAIAVSTGALAIGNFAASSTAAHADPTWGAASKPLVAMGSNTIEDIFDAYSGQAPSIGVSTASPAAPTPPNHRFTPLADPQTLEQVYSWDALNPLSTSNLPDCVNAKVGFPSMARANGSGNGKIAMSDEILGSADPWSAASASCSTPTNIQGELDMTRSSSGPGTTQCDNSVNPLDTINCLVYVDFAHDAVGYAYYAPGVTDAQAGTFNSGTNPNGGAGNPNNPADHLTTAQLTALYSNTTTGQESLTINGQTLTFIACLPQPGSGTENFFVGKIGVSTTNAEAAAAAAHCGGTTTTAIEENGGTTFQSTAASALTTDGLASGTAVAVIPFSTGSFIGQENGFGFDRTSAGVAAGVNLGVEDGTTGNTPYAGTLTESGTTWGVPPQNLSPNTTFYAGNYGRDLYVVTDNKKLNGTIAQSNAVLKRILGFLGTAWNVSGGPQSNANSGTGAICATGASTTFATSPGPPTISGPAQSYLSLFGFTSSAVACGSETIIPVAPGIGS